MKLRQRDILNSVIGFSYNVEIYFVEMMNEDKMSSNSKKRLTDFSYTTANKVDFFMHFDIMNVRNIILAGNR